MTGAQDWKDKLNSDNRDYFSYTGPMRVQKAAQTLAGMMQGIAADREITVAEAEAVRNWLRENAEFADRAPFNEVTRLLDDALADDHLDEEEVADILWLCDKLEPEGDFFCAVTRDIQRLHALLGGVAADSAITMKELDALDAWIEDRAHLQGYWPYDELASLIVDVRRDGKIDADEHRRLMNYFRDFADTGEFALTMPLDETDGTLTGLCAMQPEVVFADRSFCFTGKLTKATRKEAERRVQELGGQPCKYVTKSLHHLIIGAQGNEAWAFSCYGRKVEQAVKLRKQGCQLRIVHENDFWDAVEDA